MESFEGARGEAALLAAVIKQAITDAYQESSNDVGSALKFLFDRKRGGLIGYANALGFNAEAFRQRLLKMMQDDRSDVTVDGKTKPAPGNEFRLDQRRRFMGNLRRYAHREAESAAQRGAQSGGVGAGVA